MGKKLVVGGVFGVPHPPSRENPAGRLPKIIIKYFIKNIYCSSSVTEMIIKLHEFMKEIVLPSNKAKKCVKLFFMLIIKCTDIFLVITVYMG